MPIVLLENSIREYAWGSKTALAKIRGEQPTGQPQAELWIGTHPDGPSRLTDSQKSLEEAIAEDPGRWLGAQVAERFDGKLPFLLKIIAAAEPLSIQCHPDRVQAREGFLREDSAGIARNARHRNYRDQNPKPELLVAVTSFRALKGFRPIEETIDNFRRLGLAELDDAVDALARTPTERQLRAFYEDLMSRSDRERARLAEASLPQAARYPKAPAFAEVVRLAARYPGDLGALAPLYLNPVILRPLEALFLGPGELHAYLEGTGVELMANSNNVVRGGLTPKHIDVAELLRLLTFRAGPPHIVSPEPLEPGLSHFQSPAAEFSLELAEPRPERPLHLRITPNLRIGLVIAGQVILRVDGEEQVLKGGQSAFIQPSADALHVSGSGRLFVASVP